MSIGSRDQLLGYLLGALEPDEHERLADELEQNAHLRAEIRKLEACVGQLGLAESPEHLEPPADLVARTCQRVAAERETVVTQPVMRAAAMRLEREPAVGRRRYTWADLIVAACVLIVAGTLLFPAISYSKSKSQIAGCANNERLIGNAFHQYSTLQPDGSFPGPELTGNRAAAGVYAPILMDRRLLTTPAVFLCPGAQSRRPTPNFRPPALGELDRIAGEMLVRVQRSMGGDFGATLGYIHQGELQRPRNARRPTYVILADVPSNSQPGRRSDNHNCRGQNVLYEDGHVQFVVNLPDLLDDPYHNREGYVAPGLDCDDSVVGCSCDKPLIIVLP